MDNLREFVKKNRAAFDTEPLDEGHRGRFAAKLARGTERGASVLLRRFWAAGCAAAVVLGLLWLRTGHGQGDPVRRVIAAYKRDMDSLNPGGYGVLPAHRSGYVPDQPYDSDNRLRGGSAVRAVARRVGRCRESTDTETLFRTESQCGQAVEGADRRRAVENEKR